MKIIRTGPQTGHHIFRIIINFEKKKVFNLKNIFFYFDGLEPPIIETKFQHATNVAISYFTNRCRKLLSCTKFLECTVMFLYHYKLLC